METIGFLMQRNQHDTGEVAKMSTPPRGGYGGEVTGRPPSDREIYRAETRQQRGSAIVDRQHLEQIIMESEQQLREVGVLDASSEGYEFFGGKSGRNRKISSNVTTHMDIPSLGIGGPRNTGEVRLSSDDMVRLHDSGSEMGDEVSKSYDGDDSVRSTDRANGQWAARKRADSNEDVGSVDLNQMGRDIASPNVGGQGQGFGSFGRVHRGHNPCDVTQQGSSISQPPNLYSPRIAPLPPPSRPLTFNTGDEHSRGVVSTSALSSVGENDSVTQGIAVITDSKQKQEGPSPNAPSTEQRAESGGLWEGIEILISKLDEMEAEVEASPTTPEGRGVGKDNYSVSDWTQQLRRCVKIHQQLESRDGQLRMVHLGLCRERNLYLESLRGVEQLSQAHTHASGVMSEDEGQIAYAGDVGGRGVAAESDFGSDDNAPPQYSHKVETKHQTGGGGGGGDTSLEARS